MTHTVKFLITDPSTFWPLQTIEQLGPYSLSTRKVLELEDTYLDTKKRRLFQSGYSCRKRNRDNGVEIILTRLPARQSATKHWETVLEKNTLRPIDWPKSQVRNRVVKIVAEKKLRPILELTQMRIVRIIYENEQQIGRFNLDEIRLTTDGNEKNFKQLRVNIFSPFAEVHLKKVTEKIQEKWPLEIEKLTKLERALTLEKGTSR
jgi:inorganic triphosphatase YgiF